MELIIPKKRPLNRADKRKMWHEYERIAKVLNGAENRFITQLFQEEIEYEELYIHYLRQFNKNIVFVKDKIKPKLHYINPMYFQDNFKPLETI